MVLICGDGFRCFSFLLRLLGRFGVGGRGGVCIEVEHRVEDFPQASMQERCRTAEKTSMVTRVMRAK